jgi:GNAT superfamily N-acetyltransferase
VSTTTATPGVPVAPTAAAVENWCVRAPGISIRGARADELEALRDIDSAAGRLFVGVGMTFVAEDPPPPVELLRGHQQAGLAWVAVDPDDQPIAYLMTDRVDGNAHIEQVSVHPSFGHQRIGRSLIDHAGAWAGEQGLPALTLTTFAEVPWNAPYYLRCGFLPVPQAAMGPELAVLLAGEQERGLGRFATRLAMRKPVAGPGLQEGHPQPAPHRAGEVRWPPRWGTNR